jgi:myxalamid-type polyketide synthase MxaC
LKIAEWMVERGARNLVLTGRSAPSPDACRRVAELEKATARIAVAQADVSRESDLARLFDGMRDDLPPLRGVVHAAAVMDDGILLKQDIRRMTAVMAPKVAGAWNLHRLTHDLPLDFLVFFSSAAALLGWQGQGTYAAANAFLDALAHHRRQQGLPCLSVNWGPWGEMGLAAELDGRLSSRWERRGMDSIDPEQGIRALELAMARPDAQVAVLPVDWTAFAANTPTATGWPFLSDVIAEDAAPRTAAPTPAPSDLQQRLLAALPSERRGILVPRIQAEVAAILGVQTDRAPDEKLGLFDMGFDSLMALELKNRLEAAVGRRLPPTIAFDCPSIAALAAHLADLLAPAPTSPQPVPRAVVVRDSALMEISHLSEGELEELVDLELQRSLQ